MTAFPAPRRTAALATLIGGTIMIGLGLVATADVDSVGAAWFLSAAVSAAFLVAGLRLMLPVWRETGGPTAYRAFAVATAAFTLFGLAHVYAVADEDTAVVLFSVFMVVGALALIVGGIALLRRRPGPAGSRALTLCGVWPIATIPAGAALGDVPHFLAVTAWGLCWIALGASLRTADAPAPTAPRRRLTSPAE